VVVHVRTDDGRETPTSVPVSVVLRQPVDLEVAWWLFSIMMVVGIGLPFAVLYVANWRQCRLRPVDGLRVARIPVVVHPDGALARTDRPPPGTSSGGGLWLDKEEIKPFPYSANRTVIRYGDLEFRARKSWSPFTPPYATASARAAVAVGSDGTRTERPSGRTEYLARLPTELSGTWVLAVPRPVVAAPHAPKSAPPAPGGTAGAPRPASAEAEPVEGTLYCLLREPRFHQEPLLRQLFSRATRKRTGELRGHVVSLRVAGTPPPRGPWWPPSWWPTRPGSGRLGSARRPPVPRRTPAAAPDPAARAGVHPRRGGDASPDLGRGGRGGSAPDLGRGRAVPTDRPDRRGGRGAGPRPGGQAGGPTTAGAGPAPGGRPGASPDLGRRSEAAPDLGRGTGQGPRDGGSGRGR
jgi:translation initiation factor IF-2